MPIRGVHRTQVGTWGEDRACEFLQGLGWRIVERNWRCRAGEVDVVACEPDSTCVLVEVKTRSGLAFGAPLEAITREKLQRLRDLAVHYRREHPGVGALRIDAIGVLRARDGVHITHVRGAQ